MNAEDKEMRMRELETEVESDVRKWWNDGGREAQDNDYVYDIVDMNTPVYTNELLELAIDDNWLVNNNPDDDMVSPIDGISSNVRERLQQVAWAAVSELEDEDEAAPYCEHCGSQIFDLENSTDVAAHGEFASYVHDECLEEFLPEPEIITECEGCGLVITAADDIIIEEDEDGTELYYHPVCSPSEKEISCGV